MNQNQRAMNVASKTQDFNEVNSDNEPERKLKCLLNSSMNHITI
jgi:hypothetical protein